MSVPIWKSVLPKYYFKFYYPSRIYTKFLSTSLNLCAKKQFSMKNKFAFRDEYQRNTVNTENSKQRIFSPKSFHEHSEYEHELDDSKFTGDKFVSGELLPRQKKPIQQKTKSFEKYKDRKPSLTYQGEILFGIHPVYLALLQKRRTFYHIYAHEDMDSSTQENISRKGEIIKLARSMNIPVSFVDSRGLRSLAPDAVHQGICLDAGFLPVSSWDDEQCECDTSEDRPVWLVLDEILDPMNVGAIIRSAYYFGVNRLFTVRGNSCKLSPTVSKASSGSLEVMNICQIANLEEFVKNRKDNGWCIVSTLAYSADKPEAVNKPISVDQFNVSKPTILILGNEGKGISQDIMRLCDSLVSIESGQVLPEGIDSLNVSVAAGVLLYVLNNSKNTKR